MNAVITKLNLLVDIPYPRKTGIEKGAYFFSAATYITLFVLNMLTLITPTPSSYLPAVSLGLTVASFGLALCGGALKGAKIGVVREALQTIPLFIISLLAVLGQGTVGYGPEALKMMSIAIVSTQSISGLYYFFGATCMPYLSSLLSMGGQCAVAGCCGCSDCAELDSALKRYAHRDDVEAGLEALRDAAGSKAVDSTNPLTAQAVSTEGFLAGDL